MTTSITEIHDIIFCTLNIETAEAIYLKAEIQRVKSPEQVKPGCLYVSMYYHTGSLKFAKHPVNTWILNYDSIPAML